MYHHLISTRIAHRSNLCQECERQAHAWARLSNGKAHVECLGSLALMSLSPREGLTDFFSKQRMGLLRLLRLLRLCYLLPATHLIRLATSPAACVAKG